MKVLFHTFQCQGSLVKNLLYSSTAEAIANVRRARSSRAVETMPQENFIWNFAL